MTCKVANCGRLRAYPDQPFCQSCCAVVLRTGQEPVLPVFVPAWRTWTREHKNAKAVA
jgi:hypothetical protein